MKFRTTIVAMGLLAASALSGRAAWAQCGCGTGCSHSTCGCGCGVGGSGNGATAGGNAAFRSSNVNLLSRMSLDQLGGAGQVGSGIWGWRDSATGREYALYGISNGTSFIDITNPSAPVYLGQLPTQTGNSIWREVQTFGDRLYVASDGNGAHGVQVFDLTRLRGATSVQSWTADAVYSGVTNVHTITINSQTGYAFLNGSNVGQHVIDLNGASPMPTAVTTYNSFGGYTHDALSVVYRGPDAQYAGREILLNSLGGNGLEIVDFTNKAAPVRLSQRAYPNLGYTHQGDLTSDQRFFLSNDEFDEINNAGSPDMRTRTHVWDLADLDNPLYLGYYLHDTRVIDHNLFIKGDLVFQSNYSDGLKVFDIGALRTTDLSTLGLRADGTRNLNSVFSVAGFFDTYPADDGNPETSFNGQWGNYPYFASGTIALADRNNGLFLVAVAAPEPASALLAIVPAALLVARRRKKGQGKG